MSTRLGLGSFTYTWAIGVPGFPPPRPMTAFDLLAEARRLGVTLIQICDNLPLARLSPRELDDLDKTAREAGVAIEIGTRGLYIEDLHCQLALARRFGSPLVRVVVDHGTDEPTPREVIDRLVPFRQEFLAAGVRVALENHDRFGATTLVRIVEELGTDFAGICLDTVNSFGALEGPEAVAATLGPYVLSVHLKDFTVTRPPHQMGFVVEGCAAGRGRLNVPWLLDTLTDLAVHPFSAVLETWVSPAGDLEQTLARERAWTEDGVAHLRRHIPD